MTRDEYDEWCRRLWRCSSSGGKVSWPLLTLAEAAARLMTGPNPGAYLHKPPDGCGLFHITRDIDPPHLSRNQRQRINQPVTMRIKQARQQRARRARDRARKSLG